MAWQRVRRFLVVASLLAVVAAIAKALRGPATPSFSNHPSAGPPPERPTLVAVPDPAPVAAPVAAPTPTSDTEPPATWRDPDEDACPEGFPVKVKVRSGIFHVPGSPTYERTKPDRCYPDADTAIADGYRAPKR